MKSLKALSKQKSFGLRHPNGFGLSETVVAAGASILLIGASSLALRSTQTLVDRSESKASLRQNTTNGLRLLRSEVERSLHILVNNSEAISNEQTRTDLGHKQYADTLKQCGSLAENQTKAFKPVFGIKMAEIDTPVIYGFSVSSSNNGYALMRCGAPLDLDGRYNDANGISSLFLAKAIEDIGTMGCYKPEGNCKHPTTPEGDIKGLKEIVEDLDVDFEKDQTPIRSFMEPALRVETDPTRKLVKFIDPDPNNDPKKFEEDSYLETKSGSRTIAKYPLFLAAFARADKRLENYGSDSFHNGTYFRNVRSKRVRFLVDGSGSMSACILWGSKDYPSQPRIYWAEVLNYRGRTYKNVWYRSSQYCALTRMESLQTELKRLITSLPEDTKISLQSFSSAGSNNHRTWEKSSNGLVKIGQDGFRESAISFVNSMDNGDPRSWGGTYPWEGLDSSFDDNETDTLYFLTDGKPNKRRDGSSWQDYNYDSTVNHYLDHNKRRKQTLKTNTIAIGLASPWMEDLSTKTSGNYLQVDKHAAAKTLNNGQ